MREQKYFIKATLKNGVSGHDSSFIYKEGWNKEPNADYQSKEPCGRGIHLARNMEEAQWYVEGAEEFYLAIPAIFI